MSLLNQEDTKRRLNVYIKACEDASKMMLSSSSQCRSLIDKAMKEAESVDTVDEKNVILQLAFARIKQWSKSKSGQPFTLLVSRSSDPPLDPPVGTPSISAAISTQVSPSPRDSVSSFVNPLPSVPEGKSENILISLQGFSPPPTLPKNWSGREFSGAGDEISIMAQADGKEFEEDQGVSLSRQADKEDVTGGGEPQGDEGPKT
uniref:Uncharacterized protein n=2 Tax=Amorphochlora amoebiformis TaxID=1561963 RepID=A0A7S0DKS5_9EUKA